MNALKRTACGLYVVPDGDPRGWANFTWTTDVVDLEDGHEDSSALTLIHAELTTQIGTALLDGHEVMATDVAFACLHDGEPDRAEHEALTFADPQVDGDLIDADTGSQDWTVCGVLLDTWRTVHYLAKADHPLVAYYRAWEWCQGGMGLHFLLAAVHPGHVEAIDNFAYADPWATSPEQMAVKAAAWGERTN